MISVHTPPGTEVVYVKDVERHRLCNLPHLVIGQKYKVAEICECDRDYESGRVIFGVKICEIAHEPGVRINGFKVVFVYSRSQFQLAMLPECLTSILDKAPAPKLLEPA